MVVVDTGSTDETVAKAEAMGAKVHHFRWIEDFAAARNYSFSRCAMDWILWLDSDNVISPEDQNRILDLKSGVLNDELQAIYLAIIIRRSASGESESRGATCSPKISCDGRTRSTSSSTGSMAKRRNISTRSQFFTPPRPTGTR